MANRKLPGKKGEVVKGYTLLDVVPINAVTQIGFGFRLPEDLRHKEQYAILMFAWSYKERQYRVSLYPLESRYDNDALQKAFRRWTNGNYPEVDDAKEKVKKQKWLQTPEGQRYLKESAEYEKATQPQFGPQLVDTSNAKEMGVKLPTMKDFDLG